MNKSFFQSWQKKALLLFGVDLASIALSYCLALWLRFDCSFGDIPFNYMHSMERTVLWFGLVSIIIYSFGKLYNRIWRYAGYRELLRCVLSGLICILVHFWGMKVLGFLLPLSYFVFGGFFQLGFLLLSRFVWRFILLWYYRLEVTKEGEQERAMLVGGGSAGQLILRDLSTTHRRNINFKCIIDDDKRKWGCAIEDVPVVGGHEMIAEAVQKFKISKIYIALPTATPAQKRSILEKCHGTGCVVRTLPGIFQFADGEVSLAKMRDVTVADVLATEEVDVNPAEIEKFLRDRVVLITGGGGAIGAELALQVAACAPKKLLLLDVSENNVENITRQLGEHFPKVDIVPKVGSVRDTWCLEHLFQSFRPQIVFHSAAYKRVALMEDSPVEAFKNNVIGTYKVAYFALAYGCERFILASCDKAVNPTSFFGACARLCEMLMQTLEHLQKTSQLKKIFSPTIHHKLLMALPESAHTEFTAIRFGNTLDSSGSFFQRFRHEIAEGGPVTLSHRQMTRFCMGLRDTVKLFLQASVYASNGEIFVLDMGTPVRLDDIARKLIRLSGLVPEQDIKIQYRGLQPGEKLEEETLMWEEGMRKTPCSQIYIANPTQINFDEFLKNLWDFLTQLDQCSTCQDFQKRMAAIVNSYKFSEIQIDNKSSSREKVQTDHSPNTIRNLEDIIGAFDIQGEIVAVLPITKGYINHTYYVDVRQQDGSTQRYILQRINTKVFPDASALMKNMVRVTEHLKNFRLAGRPDEVAVARVILTKDGKNFLQHPTGAWRMVTCFLDVHSYDIPESAEVFRAAGEAFGGFLKVMADFPNPPLHEVIPNFHNTWSRYQDLLKAIEQDPKGRVKECAREIEFVKKHEALFKMISDALENDEIPLRIGHNDCNLNNVLFDNETNLPVAIIDLDTVMPSSPLYDFGDSIRIGTNTAKDDEKDLTKVSCNLNFFEAYARGWLSACGTMLTPRERELLPYAALVITSEDGIRFLMDHINGDTYYYIYYSGQNLDRARTQLALLADMEKKLPEITSLLNTISKVK